jgi:hypothetical protein
MPIGASAHPMAAFSGFYESHGPPPSGNELGIVPAHRNGHQSGQQREHILHLCFVCCCPGDPRSDTERLVARWRHLVAFMNAALHSHTTMAIVKAQQRRCFCSLSLPYPPDITIAKNHGMVHLNSLTAMVFCERPLFYELLWCV